MAYRPRGFTQLTSVNVQNKYAKRFEALCRSSLKKNNIPSHSTICPLQVLELLFLSLAVASCYSPTELMKFNEVTQDVRNNTLRYVLQ